MSDAEQKKPAPAVVVMGVSACGKSTVGQGIADALGIPFEDGDKYHPEPNIIKMRSGIPLNDEDRKSWLITLSALLSKKVAEGTGVVIACSALKISYRNTLRSHHGGNDRKEVAFVFLKGSFDLFNERITGRQGHFMPSTLLQSQFDTLQVPEPDEAQGESCPPGVLITVDAALKPEEICKESVEIIQKHFKTQ